MNRKINFLFFYPIAYYALKSFIICNLIFLFFTASPFQASYLHAKDASDGDRAESLIANGVKHIKNNFYSKEKYQSVHILEFDLNSDFEMESVFGQDCMYKKETVSSMAKRKNAVAAINGAFFSQSGNPMGMLVHQGKIIKEPILGRTVFGLTTSNEFFFDNPKFDARFFYQKDQSCEIEFVELDGINRQPQDDEIIIFTSEYGNKTRTSYNNSLEIIVLGEKVISIGTHNSTIPPDGYVIYASGVMSSEMEKIAINYTAYMELYVNPVWEQAKFAVGGGPRLLKDGEIICDKQSEKFKSDVTSGRAPRTAIGITADRKILLICVDGRQKNAAGMTLKELAAYLKKLGAKDAMNLDGGGSTTFFLMGRVVNSPSDGRERPVSQALVIKPKDNLKDYAINLNKEYNNQKY